MKIENMFIPYNRAKKLKALKFKEECFGSYADVEVSTPILVKRIISDDQGGYFTLAPLFCQVFDWFREKYNLNSFIVDSKSYNWYFNISDMLKDDVVSEVLYFKTFEEAQLACLDKLIEICEKSVS